MKLVVAIDVRLSEHVFCGLVIRLTHRDFLALRGYAMRLPVIQGVIDRRMLVNYRVDPRVLETILPAPFRPQAIVPVRWGVRASVRVWGVSPHERGMVETQARARIRGGQLRRRARASNCVTALCLGVSPFASFA